MKNPICISTGLVYKILEDMDKKIELLKQFSPEGIELNFAFSQDLIEFIPSFENIKYLQRIRTSIHAPWHGVIYEDNKKCGEVLSAIERLYKKINAECVTFHHPPTPNILKKYNFIASVENEDWRKGLNSPSQIEEVLKNPRLRFTFDFAHALTVSKDQIPLYLDRFKNKLIQIHLSYLDRQLQDHYFLNKNDSQEIRELIKLLPQNTPIILEAVASDKNEVYLIKNEMEYLKKL